MPYGDAIVFLGLALAFGAVLWVLMFLKNRIKLLSVKGPRMLRPLLQEFEQIINKAETSLAKIPQNRIEERPAEGRWSKKEILGHLIDSACNNHQRFVRARFSSEIRLPSYNQEGWVHVQDYQTEPWSLLVQFWCSYNRHLHHVIASLPAENLPTLCFIGDDMPVTLESLVRDYVEHVKHHLKQILGDEEAGPS